MYQTGPTIKETLDKIHRHDLVLPAIQREFVWGPDQIYRLFDSLMQGYPFGTFLYWQVEPEHSHLFNFYDFVLNYHERDSRHCPPLPLIQGQRVTAILDGQQRLTALNIGLRGTMAWKRPRLWRNNPHAYPKRKLCLDLLWQPDEDNEHGLQYRFSFRTDERSDNDNECWFPVGEVLSMDGALDMLEWLNPRLRQDQLNLALKPLDKLHSLVHKEHLIAFYQEQAQELDKVLQIFIRMNDGGTQLSHSDLLLSVATAQWTQHDAREEIHGLVDELNRIGAGFSFSKDLVLKAGLMLSDIGSVGFKVDNFNRQNMDVFERNWNGIERALTLTVQLVADFGFSERNLRAHNSILPIAYYLYRKDPGHTYLTSSHFEDDRRRIREWIMRSLLKTGVWGSGMDTLLTALRHTIALTNADVFPDTQLAEELARRGRPLAFGDEEIEELSDMRYGEPLTFALLSLLVPSLDLRNQFHIDHVFPSALFSRQHLTKEGVPDDDINRFIQLKDGLANLQLLSGPENQEKRAMMPAKWLTQRYPDRASRLEYAERHFLERVPEAITEFADFYGSRKDCLKAAIKQLIGTQPVQA